jgi:hypothetical protein
MTANELLDFNEKIRMATEIDYLEKKCWHLIKEIHLKDETISQQAQEIADLKIANQDLKYQLIQKFGEQVLNDFKELTDKEILDVWIHCDTDNDNVEITTKDYILFARAILKKARDK